MGSDSARLLGREGERCPPLRGAAASQRTKHAIRAAIHCEVVITRANERAICPHIKVLANEGLFIIGEHKSSHNPISCLLIPVAGREAHLGRRRTKGSKTRRGALALRDLGTLNLTRTPVSWWICCCFFPCWHHGGSLSM